MHADTLRSVVTRAWPYVAARYLIVAAVVASTGMVGCTSRMTRAPVTDLSEVPSSAPSAATGGTYVVKPGDTLYKVAQAHNIDVARLGQLNNITDPGQLRVGQVLRLDGKTPQPDAGFAVTAPVIPVQAVEPVVATSEPVRATDSTLVNWGWPADGKIIQGFNTNTKGIDLEGNAGDPVLAAANGKVMYTGNGVRGMGNLILIGHSDGFISAYGHNQELLVKTGQEITKGAKIATVGQSDTTSPRLHFEVRRRGTPVNPLSYLPVR